MSIGIENVVKLHGLLELNMATLRVEKLERHRLEGVLMDSFLCLLHQSWIQLWIDVGIPERESDVSQVRGRRTAVRTRLSRAAARTVACTATQTALRSDRTLLTADTRNEVAKSAARNHLRVGR